MNTQTLSDIFQFLHGFSFGLVVGHFLKALLFFLLIGQKQPLTVCVVMVYVRHYLHFVLVNEKLSSAVVPLAAEMYS